MAFSLNQWIDRDNTTAALIGVLNFDGAGNITGTYTLVNGGPGYALLTGTLTGAYSSNADGSNTANLKLDVGVTVILALTVTDGGNSLLLLVTGGTGPSPGQVISGSGRIQSAQGSVPAGSYGYLLNRWPDSANPPVAIFGVVTLDGSSSVSGSFVFGGSSGNGSLNGTYSINADGTGSLTLGNLAFAIVIIDGGSGILMLQTSVANGTALTHILSGTARMQ